MRLKLAFGSKIDYAMLVKIYGADRPEEARYSPAEFISCRAVDISGKPDPKHISTSYVERQNLTMRMHMRRFTRLTNGFSKKLEHHIAAVSLHFMYYNFVKIHSTIRMTPAMAAGVTDHLWEMSDVVALLEDQKSEEMPNDGIGSCLLKGQRSDFDLPWCFFKISSLFWAYYIAKWLEDILLMNCSTLGPYYA
jgi:hypothetical protein